MKSEDPNVGLSEQKDIFGIIIVKERNFEAKIRRLDRKPWYVPSAQYYRPVRSWISSRYSFSYSVAVQYKWIRAPK